jgi:hypothetical protein
MLRGRRRRRAGAWRFANTMPAIQASPHAKTGRAEVTKWYYPRFLARASWAAALKPRVTFLPAMTIGRRRRAPSAASQAMSFSPSSPSASARRLGATSSLGPPT